MNRKSSTALLSIGSNITLISTKVVVGILTGSVSIISEAIHSSMDLMAAIIAFFSVRSSDNPPDPDHPYGHGKIENVSGVIEAILILVASGWIVFEAVKKILHPGEMESVGIGFFVMIFSGVVNIFVSRRLYKVAREEDSVALAADALHLKADVITSFGVAVGLFAIWLPSLWGMNLGFLDPVVAIGVAIFITKEAVQMLIHAFKPLMDHSLPEEEQALVKRVIEEFQPHGASFHCLRSRRSGKFRHIDFHLTLPPELTILQAHELCDKIETRIEQLLPHTVVLIHVEPEDHAEK